MCGREEAAKDLADKVKRGELTPEQVAEEMERRGLTAHAGELFPGMYSVTGFVVWGILCFVPTILHEVLHIKLPAVLTSLPKVTFPTPVIWAALLFFLASFYFIPYGGVVRKQKGGGTEEHTVFLIRQGPYSIVRHPEFLGGLLWIITIPLLASPVFPFTALSFLGDVIAITGAFLQSQKEDRFNILKWGDKYRHYMREVPRFNFMLGIWRWAKRK